MKFRSRNRSRRNGRLSFPTVRTRGEPVDEIAFHRITESRSRCNRDSAAGAHLHFGLDNVFVPVAATGRNITRQSKPRQCRHGDVVGTPDARLQHASTPDWNGVLAAHVVDTAGLTVAAHAA